jgi:heme/copper-type cytochrome/quinol oxidase subunit 2
MIKVDMYMILKIIGPLLFYTITIFILFYSAGKYRWSKNHDQYLMWVKQHGYKVTRAVKIIVVLYTLIYILSLVFDSIP